MKRMTDENTRYFDVTVQINAKPAIRYRRVAERNIRRAVNKVISKAWSEPGMFGVRADSLSVLAKPVQGCEVEPEEKAP